MNIIPCIFLEKMQHLTVNTISEELNFFHDDLPHAGLFKAKLLQWGVSYMTGTTWSSICILVIYIFLLSFRVLLFHFQTYRKNSTVVSTALNAALKGSSKALFPSIHTILHILLTFPVTTCTCERSISVPNRVKSCNLITQTGWKVIRTLHHYWLQGSSHRLG